MEVWQAVLLAIVEGVTEFLPVSSTGHMVLLSKIIGIEDSDFLHSYEVIIQLGAIMAVALRYVKQLSNVREWWGKLLVSFAPTIVVGAGLYPVIKNVFLSSQTLVAVSLLVGGVVLVVFERWSQRVAIKGEGEISYQQAWWAGLGQTLAVVPGVSRSMATILAARMAGVPKVQATELSFILAVPTMLAATVKDGMEVGLSWSQGEIQLICLGLVIAFVTAWLVVSAFLKYVETRSLELFGWYRIVIGILYLLIMR